MQAPPVRTHRAAAPLLWAGRLLAQMALAWWLALACGMAHAAGSLVLRDDLPRTPVWPAVTMQWDASRSLALGDIRARSDRFVPPPNAGGTLGVHADALWLRIPLEVAPASDGHWALDINHADLGSVDAYLLDGGQLARHTRLGSSLPYADRPLLVRSHAVDFWLQPGKSYELLLRIETRGAFILPITFNKPAALLQHAVDEQMLQGVLTGLALCLIVYSLAQWVSLRDPLFAQYAMMTSGSLLFSLHFFGIGPQYLWGSSAWATEHAAGLSAFLATGGGFLFIGQALSGHEPQSRLLRSMRAGCGLCVLLGIAYGLNLLSTSAVVLIVSALGPVPSLMGIPGAVRRMRAGDSVGSTLLLAWFAYFVAVTTMICLINGLLPVNFWTLHSFQFGATLDMLLFMRVLGLHSKALRAAAESARSERDAMRSLAHTDPLTGLPNRRGLGLALTAALAHCDSEHLVAVYVMDLDGFKPVNDQHGHDVGDELLVAVARRLQGLLRKSDLVARLGGDEFVVMVSQLDSAEQAHEMGQKLLEAFHQPFALPAQDIQVGLTIGYALAPTDSSDAVGLLKLADAAMYAGKQGGKFRVLRNPGDLALASR